MRLVTGGLQKVLSAACTTMVLGTQFESSKCKVPEAHLSYIKHVSNQRGDLAHLKTTMALGQLELMSEYALLILHFIQYCHAPR